MAEIDVKFTQTGALHFSTFPVICVYQRSLTAPEPSAACFNTLTSVCITSLSPSVYSPIYKPGFQNNQCKQECNVTARQMEPEVLRYISTPVNIIAGRNTTVDFNLRVTVTYNTVLLRLQLVIIYVFNLSIYLFIFN